MSCRAAGWKTTTFAGSRGATGARQVARPDARRRPHECQEVAVRRGALFAGLRKPARAEVRPRRGGLPAAPVREAHGRLEAVDQQALHPGPLATGEVGGE